MILPDMGENKAIKTQPMTVFRRSRANGNSGCGAQTRSQTIKATMATAPTTSWAIECASDHRAVLELAVVMVTKNKPKPMTNKTSPMKSSCQKMDLRLTQER